MSRTTRRSPAELTVGWPACPSEDHAAEIARQFAQNLAAAVGGRSVRSVARDADVDEGTLRRILSGATWPDLRTIALLEQALGGQLYPVAIRGIDRMGATTGALGDA